jgi:hypothetical protein
MLERLVKIRQAVDHVALESPEGKDLFVEADEWTSAKGLLAFLAPFKTYTKLLEGNCA